MKSFAVAAFAVATFAAFNVQAGAPSTLDNERAARKADIEFYTTGFDGGAAQLDCVRPAIPPTSRTNAEIAKVDKGMQDWFACYNAFAQRLNDVLPPGKAVPPELARIMLPAELAQAREHMNLVYGQIGDEAQATASALMEEHQAWRASTVLYATTKNEATRKAMEVNIAEYELRLTRLREMNSGSANYGRNMR